METESKEFMKKPASTATPELEQIRKEASTDLAPVNKAKALQVTDPNTFARADAILGQLDARCNHYNSLFDAILDPLNVARTAAIKARKEVMEPWNSAVEYVRLQMKNFKLHEAQMAREEQIRIEIEQRKLLEEAQRKERQAEQAKNPKVQERLQKAAEALTEQASEVAAVPVVAPVAVAGSTTRTVKAWRLLSLPDLVEAVMHGKVPIEALKVDEDFMRLKMRVNHGEVAHYPGIEVYEDIQIVRR